VAVAAVQAALRRIFEQWGLPKRMRVDNGAPWASWADLPTAFALWLIGLGIRMTWNHPHCPKENAKVERCNGLVGSWGDPATCADEAAWRRQIAHVVEVQRERYPATAGGRTRQESFPQLATNERRYRANEEAQQFDLERVKQYLAQGKWPRLVSKIGQITLYGKAYRVGRRWAGEQVWLQFDAAMTEWVVRDKAGEALIRHTAEQITVDRIRNVQVAHPRPPSKKKRQNPDAYPPT
jgi:transposase InsO family protein